MIEGELRRADGFVAVAQQQGADGVYDAGYDSEHPKSPGQTDSGDHGACGQGVDEASQTRTTSREAVGQRAAGGEPLRDDADAGDEHEAHSKAEADPLREEELPDGFGEGGSDQTGGFEDYSQKQREASAVHSRSESGERGD